MKMPATMRQVNTLEPLELSLYYSYICPCIRAYKWEVTGSHLTQAKKFLFLGVAGLGFYNRQPTDTASNGTTNVSCFKKNGGAQLD